MTGEVHESGSVLTEVRPGVYVAHTRTESGSGPTREPTLIEKVLDQERECRNLERNYRETHTPEGTDRINFNTGYGDRSGYVGEGDGIKKSL